jgi:DNA primase
VKVFRQLADVYKENLWKSPAVLNYLIQERGLTKEILLEAEVGFCEGNIGKYALVKAGLVKEASELKLIGEFDYFNGFITFPIYKEGKVYSFYARRFKGEGMHNHSFPDGRSNHHPYGEQLLPNQESIVAVEAPICALSLLQHGISAVSVMGCNMNDELLKFFVDKNVYIMFDNDHAGEQGSVKAARKLMGKAKNVFMAKLPGKPGTTKIDVNDYFNTNKYAEIRIKELLKNLQPLNLAPIPIRNEKRKKMKEDEVEIRQVARLLFSDSKYDLYESGDSVWVKCPHHSQGVEKNRSLWIGGKKNMFNCFGCQTGGGPVRLVNWHLGLSFPDAREWIRSRLKLPSS